jgi:hypothetical protein
VLLSEPWHSKVAYSNRRITLRCWKMTRFVRWARVAMRLRDYWPFAPSSRCSPPP